MTLFFRESYLMHVNIRCNQTVASGRWVDASGSRRQTTASGGRDDYEIAASAGLGTRHRRRRRYLVREQTLDQRRRVRRGGRDRPGLVHDGGRACGLLGWLRWRHDRPQRLRRDGRLVDHDHVLGFAALVRV